MPKEDLRKKLNMRTAVIYHIERWFDAFCRLLRDEYIDRWRFVDFDAGSGPSTIDN